MSSWLVVFVALLCVGDALVVFVAEQQPPHHFTSAVGMQTLGCLSNVVPFTPAENDCICMLSWQSWDFLIFLLATGNPIDLRGYMCEAEAFCQPENRKTLVVVAQDAVPVYLDLSTGKILVTADMLDTLNHRRVAKKLAGLDNKAAVVELTGLEVLTDAQGS